MCAQHHRSRLRTARELRGWTQLEVADRIGTTHVNVGRWEHGLTHPRPYYRSLLCNLFGMSEQELGLAAHQQPSEIMKPCLVSDPAIPSCPALTLVGREVMLAYLKERLCMRSNQAFVALWGLPGVGKTALASALAYDADVHARFADGVLWAGLGPHPNVAGVFSRWGKLLGLSESSAELCREGGAMALRDAIGQRALLLVIDDAWKMEDVFALCIGGPSCAYLVTTRFPGIAAHVAITCAAAIHELDEEQSMRLLRLLAPDAVRFDARRLADLVQAIGGLPLALTLIGTYLRQQAYGGQPHRIAAALSRLADAGVRLHLSEPQVPAQIHPSLSGATPLSLHAVIAVSDQHLSVPARAALRRLAACSSPAQTFSEEEALALASCELETLDDLLDAGLLSSNGGERYTLHPIIADYARLAQ
jgi:DNA-binding XRE family transcriptional regulator